MPSAAERAHRLGTSPCRPANTRPAAYAEGVLRTRTVVRPLGPRDHDEALALCARDPVRHVFAAARLQEAARAGTLGSFLGFPVDGALASICWSQANVVPVAVTVPAREAFAETLKRARPRIASLLGPREEVTPLWALLEPKWGPPRALRARQPLLATSVPPSARGLALHPDVRLARSEDVDAILPAAAHMFTHEIGYPPYSGSSRSFRSSLAELAEQGHTYVVRHRERVVFKSDIGSWALGCAQLQGVWLAPALRGQGLATAMVAAVVDHVLSRGAKTVSLYVNDYNLAARAVYNRVGFETVGEFTTILM